METETILQAPVAAPQRPATAPEPESRVPWVRQAVITLVLVGVVAGAYLTFRSGAHGPAPQHASAPRALIAVATVRVEPRDVPVEAQYLAQTEPTETVPIRARVSGYLIERDFVEGQSVSKGQVLFRIDPKPFEVALKQAQAGLSAAQAQYDRARQQVARFEGLAELQQAAANELEQAQEQLRIAAAQVETGQAEVEHALLDLGYATIASPLDGVIGERAQDVGSYVGGVLGDTLLATVRKVDPLHVRFSVSERDLLRWQSQTQQGLLADVPLDQRTVRVVLADGRELAQRGHIDYVDVAVDPSTGTAVLRATVPNPAREVRPGQYVQVWLGGLTRLGALVVPQPAVMQTPGGASVYVVEEGGPVQQGTVQQRTVQQRTVQQRTVELGDWTADGWIIESGLKAGDVVVVDHLLQLRPGTAVTVSDS